MITYILVIVIFGGNGVPAMALTPDFPTYEACKFAGEAFVKAAKNERGPRFYCFPAEGRGE